jgi:hypothetical protein
VKGRDAREYHRRWFSREPIDDTFVDLIVGAVLAVVPR